MASADELRWQSYRDFTGGLWERGNDREVPENGLLECQDCYPLPTGGLRAGPVWRDEVVEGIGNHAVAGFFVSNVLDTTASGDVHDQYVAGWDETSVGALELYHRGSTFARTSAGRGSEWPSERSTATWSTFRSYSSALTADQRPISFVSYYNQAGIQVYYNVLNGGAAATTNQGVFRIANGTSVANMTTEEMYYLGTHQDRLVGVSDQRGGLAGGIRTEGYLRWTSAGGETFTTNNWLFVTPNAPGNIIYIRSSYPSDLAVLKDRTGIFYVQGPLLNPSVREVNEIEPTEQETWGELTPIGVVYMTKNRGVFVWGGGTQVQPLSRQFVGSPMAVNHLRRLNDRTFLGTCVYANRWVYFPKGYVYDIDLSCWFRTTLPHGIDYPFWTVSPTEGRVFALGNEVAEGADRIGQVRMITTRYNTDDMERASSYSFTLPLIYQPARDVILRELELHLQTFSETSAVDVTITRGDPRSGEDEAFDVPRTEVEGIGKHPVRIQLGRNPGSANATWWKVRVTLSSVPGEERIPEVVTHGGALEIGSRSAEAPMLERLLLAWQEGTRYRVGA